MSQPTLSIGTKLCGKEITYMVTKILGQGSFGITYKVKAFTIVKGSFGEERYEFPQPKAVKEFFMKELNGRTESGSVTGISSGSLSYNYAQKFRSEAGNLAKMKHQNIVRVIDFIEANGTYYYVMDYVEGENLNEYIKHNKLTENEVVDIIRKVADALIYMHEEQKMLHLDLKPGNIMRRSSDGHIFLIDFGFSMHSSDGEVLESSVGFGNPCYRPVEQSNGTVSAQFRPTMDIYALGATMYKLLTGETPPTSWMLVHDDDEGFIENSLNRYSVSKKIAKVITKAMSPKVKDRQQSVREFLNEINDLDILVSMTQPTLTIGTELCGENNNVAYKVIQILGQGSFGITYKVKAFTMVKGSFGEERYEFPQPKAVKEFFMKELNGRTESGSVTGISSGSLSYNYAQKFRSEAGNLAKMKHQNIVRVIDFIEANGTYYYVMDYVDGENLNEYIKHNKLTENEVVDIIRKVADALIYMHEEQKMLHLDLKPGNIMRRSSDGHIFLIDFGLSKHFSDNGTPETSTTVGFGTAGYAPVEQSNGTASAQFRPTIDVYALGATMYKLLTGETPPTSPDLMNDEGFIKDSLNRYSVSKKVAKVIIKAMSPKFKDRQQSVKEFVKGLPEVKQNEFGEREYTDTTDNSNKDDETRTEDTEPIVEVVHEKPEKKGLFSSLVARYTQRYEERHIVTNIVLYGIQIVSLLSLIVLGVVMIHLSRTYKYLTYSMPLFLLSLSLLIGNSMILRWKKRGLSILLLSISLILPLSFVYGLITVKSFYTWVSISTFCEIVGFAIGLYIVLLLKKNGISTWNLCEASNKVTKIVSMVALLLSIFSTVYWKQLSLDNRSLEYKYPAFLVNTEIIYILDRYAEDRYPVEPTIFDIVLFQIHCENKKEFIVPYDIKYIWNHATWAYDNELWVWTSDLKLTSITIPPNVKCIGNDALSGISELENITIQNGVEFIGERAFWGCEKLKTINIPSSVEKIGSWAFCGCTNLKTLNIPSSVSYIGNFAFKDCLSLETIEFEDEINLIGDYGIFGGDITENSIEIFVPYGTKDVFLKQLYSDRQYIKEIFEIVLVEESACE